MKLIHHKGQLLILMILLLFVSQACTDIYISGLPLMTREFNTRLEIMNLTISVYVYAQAFFFLFTGVVSDIFGRRKILLIGILAQIVASLAIAVSHSLPLIILLRIIQALGSGVIYIVLRLLIKDVMDRDEQIHATAMLLIGLVLSPALAPVVGAWLIHFSGWRACFALIAAVQIPLLAWTFYLISETNRRMAEFRAAFKFKLLCQAYAKVVCDRFFYALALLVGGTFASYYSFISISSYMYIDEYHISNTVYSYLFIGVAAAYLTGNRLMLWLNKHQVRSYRIICCGLILSLFGMLLLMVSLCFKSQLILIFGMTTSGILLIRAATAFINPPIQVAVTHHFGDLGAHAIGLLSCQQYLFAGLGSVVVSTLPLAPSVSLVVSSLLFTAVSLLGFYLWPKTEPL